MADSTLAGRKRLRWVAGSLALADVGLLAVRRTRPRLTEGFLGPSDGDLSTWSAGVIATYTAAQAVIAVRPSPEAARVLAALRLVLIGGDVMLAREGRTIDRRCAVLATVGNGLFALAAFSASRTEP